jgi:hypothetical protein
MTDPAGRPALQDAIRHLHGVESEHIETVHARDLSLRDRPISASLAVCVARLAGVGVDDVLTGKYPPACAHTAGTVA